MSLASFSTVVSGVAVATALTITSLAFILLCFRDRGKLSVPTTTTLMSINATFIDLPMPTFHFSAEEQQDVIAYILSLRSGP
jgi:hypothetical protein